MDGFIPYIFPLILGRTFDLSSMRIGVDIFDKEIYQNIRIHDQPFFKGHFGQIENRFKKEELLQFPDPFASYIKSGIVNAGASGEYLSDIEDFVSTVDMVTRSHWMSSIQYVNDSPEAPEPISNWTDYGKALGTHDAYQIAYGGEFIASMRFTTKEKEKIQGPLSNKVFELGSQAQDEYVQDILKSINSTQIKIFSSIPLTNIPNDMESLYNRTQEGYLSDLKQFHNGKGLPLWAKLRSLTWFDSSGNISTYIKDKRILGINVFEDFSGFDNAFQNLRETKALISTWMKTIRKPLTVEQEKEIADLYNVVENLIKFFYEVLDTLGTPQGNDQLMKAKEEYFAQARKLKSAQSLGFKIIYFKLRRKIEKELESSN